MHYEAREAALTPFERDLLALVVPRGSIFTIEFRFGSWDWLRLADVCVEQFAAVPGLDETRALRIVEETRLRRQRWTDECAG